MSKYVDGFVIVIPKKNLNAYKKMAVLGGKIWRKHGALDYKECVSDDLHPDMGPFKQLGFPGMTKAKKSEVIVFSYILYKSKAHRNQVNAKVMKDPAMNSGDYNDINKMPFKMNQMATGGFTVIVDA